MPPSSPRRAQLAQASRVASSRSNRLLEEYSRGPKWAWVLVILFVPVFGLALWYVFGRSSFRPREDSGPVAPDDDPEFLRRIADDVEAEKRRRKHAEDAEERRRAESGTGSAADGRRPVDGSAAADDPDLPDAQRHRDEQNRPGPDDPRM